jgi:hypothetical protein
VCAYLDGKGRPPDGLGPSWKQQGASYLSLHTTPSGISEHPGTTGRDEAIAGAVTSAAEAALDLLDQRGVSYDRGRRTEIVREAVSAGRAGSEIAFPRFRIADTWLEECVSEAGDALPDADQEPRRTWKATILAEYPIGYLRGDVNNARWDRRRAASEAEVLLASAEERLGTGRWMAALVERAEALRVIREAGVEFPPPAPYRGDGAGAEDAEFEDKLRELSTTAVLVRDALASLYATPLGRVLVVEPGTQADASAEFQFAYRWLGREVPAIGVPVRFDLQVKGAVLKAEPLTDGWGIARCVVAGAHGEAGEYRLGVEPDMPVVSEVDPALELRTADDSDLISDGGEAATATAVMTVHLVEGAHAVSVCVELEGAPQADIAQVVAGFARRMERDGFRIEDCGASVDVVLKGNLALQSSARDGAWEARVSLGGDAFDQRTASDLGETTVNTVETSAEGAREAEVIALKEAGRLLAVYFGSRILLDSE